VISALNAHFYFTVFDNQFMPYGVGFMEWLLYDVLQVPPEMVTGVFLKDLVNLILLPSVVLMFFIFSVTNYFIPPTHKKWSTLLSITFYLVIIVQGFYGIFVSFIQPYIIFFLVTSFVAWVVVRMLPPPYMVRVTKITGKFGEKVADIKRIKEELERLKRDRDRVRRYILDARARGEEHTARIFQMRLDEIESEINRLEMLLKRLKRVV